MYQIINKRYNDKKLTILPPIPDALASRHPELRLTNERSARKILERKLKINAEERIVIAYVVVSTRCAMRS